VENPVIELGPNSMTGFSTDRFVSDDRMRDPVRPGKCGTRHNSAKTNGLRQFFDQLWYVPHSGHGPLARHVLPPDGFARRREFSTTQFFLSTSA
jgi:hypothetical protein